MSNLKLVNVSVYNNRIIATIKGSKDPILWKSMRILLDSGCAATLINQDLVNHVKPHKIIEQSVPQKLVTLVLTGNVR
jgi:hypothetical protein